MPCQQWRGESWTTYTSHQPRGSQQLLYGRVTSSPFARLPTTSVAWNRSSSSLVHVSCSCRTCDEGAWPGEGADPLLACCVKPLLSLLLPPRLTPSFSSPASGRMTPCVTASSFLCSCPTISFLRFRRASACASGVVGFESSASADGIMERPMVRGWHLRVRQQCSRAGDSGTVGDRREGCRNVIFEA